MAIFRPGVPGFKRRNLSSEFSTERSLISASVIPHCVKGGGVDASPHLSCGTVKRPQCATDELGRLTVHCACNPAYRRSQNSFSKTDMKSTGHCQNQILAVKFCFDLFLTVRHKHV